MYSIFYKHIFEKRLFVLKRYPNFHYLVLAADRNWMVGEWIVKYDISYKFLPVLWIRTAFNADPDPSFPQCWSGSRKPDQYGCGFKTDPGRTLPSQTSKLLFQYTLCEQWAVKHTLSSNNSLAERLEISFICWFWPISLSWIRICAAPMQ